MRWICDALWPMPRLLAAALGLTLLCGCAAKKPVLYPNAHYEAMGSELHNIWGGQPDQLNNAYIAFQMTYYRHLLLMHRVLEASDFELAKTIKLLRSMPEQGKSFSNLEQVKVIEASVVDYLSRNL